MSNELEFIKGFSSISIAKICRELNVNQSNLVNGKTNHETVLKVKNRIELEYFKLYKEYIEREFLKYEPKTDTL